MNSLQLAVECHKRGLLSKEAYVSVLHTRERIIKEAMAKQANTLFSTLGRTAARGGEKAKGFLTDVLRGLKGESRAARQAGKHSKSWGEVTGELGRLMAMGGIAAGAIGAGHGLMRHRQEKGLKDDIEHSYKAMFNEYPKLKDVERHKVQRHFGVLARYAPALAANPTVAGSFVQSSALLGYIEPTMVQNLAHTQAEIDRAAERKRLFPPGHFQRSVPLAAQAMNV